MSTCKKCAVAVVAPAPFTISELYQIQVAARLRAEACEENGEEKEAKAWQAVVAKAVRHVRSRHE